MKKSILLLLLAFILCITGCKNEDKIDSQLEEKNLHISEENNNSESGNIEKITTGDNEIAILQYNGNGEPYVKLSDSYYLESNEIKELPRKEILPSKIYMLDPSILDKYSVGIPIEKCNSQDEQRIVYEKYGIEKSLFDGTVKIGNLKNGTYYFEGLDLSKDSIKDYKYDINDDIGYLVAFLTNSEIEINNRHYHSQEFVGHIYECSLDDNDETKEILVCATNYGASGTSNLSVFISYNEKDEQANKIGEIDSLESQYLYQVGQYKNVLCSPLNMMYVPNYGKYFSNFILNYWVYDGENDLIEIEKLANGDSVENIDINLLDNCILRDDFYFLKVSDTYLKDTYEDRVEYILSEYQSPSDESITLKKGSKLKILEVVDEYGNFIVESEDGTKYGFILLKNRIL